MAVILAYHRVCDLARDSHGLAVSPRVFDEQLAALRRDRTLVPLRDVALGTAPPSAVALTFDDGYLDNLTLARPILQRWDAPATFFVTADALAPGHEFWWDRLERIAFAAPMSRRRARLRAVLRALPYVTRSPRLAWHLEAAVDPRHAANAQLWSLLRRLDEPRRQRVLRDLGAAAGVGDEVPASHRSLGEEELRRLAIPGLFEIGSHGVTHVSFVFLDAASQRRELSESKRVLERALGSPVDAFAFPFGESGDPSVETTRLVADAGYRYAVVHHLGRAGDVYRLPRLMVRGWSGRELAARIAAVSA